MSLPAFVSPMLAQLGDEPFDSADHLFEVKWDGIRGLAFCEGGSYRLSGRSRSDLAPRYPELEYLAELPEGTLLDGEIVAFKNGRPDFYHGMQRTHAKNPRRIARLAQEVPVSYVVFDILYQDGESLLAAPLSERVERLAEVVRAQDQPRLVHSEGVVGAGVAMFEGARERQLEGIVAKRLDSAYLEGKRTDAWIKLKPRREMPCVILGFQAEGRDLRSLVIGAEEEGALVCVGRVASGLSDRTREKLWNELAVRRRDEPLVPCDMEAEWVTPELYCTVSYLERTPGGLRAPVFVRLTR